MQIEHWKRFDCNQQNDNALRQQNKHYSRARSFILVTPSDYRLFQSFFVEELSTQDTGVKLIGL